MSADINSRDRPIIIVGVDALARLMCGLVARVDGIELWPDAQLTANANSQRFEEGGELESSSQEGDQ